jgi:hypothetical protein
MEQRLVEYVCADRALHVTLELILESGADLTLGEWHFGDVGVGESKESDQE